MSIRTFIFCDACNPQGVRTIDDGAELCRRNYDQRAWFEGHVDEADEAGWILTRQGLNICPRCQKNGLGDVLAEKKPSSSHYH